MRRKGFAHLILLCVIVVAAIGGIVYWNLARQNNNNFIPNLNGISYPSPYPTYAPTPGVTLEVELISSSQPVPEINTLYYGLYKGKRALFFSSKSAQTEKWNIGDGHETSPYHGYSTVFDEAYGSAINFKDFPNAKTIKVSAPITSQVSMHQQFLLVKMYM